MVTISGMKFEDEDANAVKDADEAGLEGWTIVLIDPSDESVIATTTTAATTATTAIIRDQSSVLRSAVCISRTVNMRSIIRDIRFMRRIWSLFRRVRLMREAALFLSRQIVTEAVNKQ